MRHLAHYTILAIEPSEFDLRLVNTVGASMIFFNDNKLTKTRLAIVSSELHQNIVHMGD